MGSHFLFRVVARLYRSILLRVIIIFSALICLLYYTWLLPWVNRAISEEYQKQTGHLLTHDKIDVHLFQCNFNLNHLKDSANLWQADAVHVDLACKQSIRERSLVISNISIQQLKASIHKQLTGLWSFNDVILHQQNLQKKSAHKNSTHSGVPVCIKSITLANASLDSNSLVLNNLPVSFAPLNLTITNVDLRTNAKAGFSLKANVNKSAQITLIGNVDLASLSGELDLDAYNIPFVWFDSALKPYASLDVLSGTLDLNSHVTLVGGTPRNVRSKGKLIDLKIRPTAMEQDAVKWKSFEWEDADIALTEKSIHIPLLSLNGLDGQFIVDKNRKTNVQAIFVPSEKVDDKKSIVSSEIVSSGNASSGIVSSTTAPAPTEEKPWSFSVDRLAINKAAIGFYDQSLTPSFSTIVQEFSGDVTNISSDENTFAVINMAGNVDGYSPVTLKGKVNLLSTKPMLDALLSFKQLDMGALSPYSAEYAGWRINKGLLSADLNYHYEDGKILGKNHVVIDHLEFGEKARGTRVLDIPLRLGLALLTDQNGVAVLDTEISGAPNDPQFKLRDIIVRALGNTLKKILLSPFKFLSNLINSKEDLGRIQFNLGESQLTDAAKDKLKLLTEAMAKRPNMRLSVQGVYDEKSDLIALKEEQVKSALQKKGLSEEALSARNEVWASAVNTQYQALGLTNLSISAEQKYSELIAAEIVDPERLKKLAHERAQAVKQYFVLQLAVASDSILLDSDSRCEASGNCSSSEAIFTLEL